MQKKQIAVIMSVYKNDQLKYVQQSVESILSQTFQNFDFYIQFDGTLRIEVELYLRSIQDERLKINIRSENKGLAYSLNELINIVLPLGYEYIARMDADDISKSNRFEKQVNYLELHPNVDCLGSAINEIDDKGNDRGKIVHYPCCNDECLSFFEKRNPLAHPTVMFRRSFFDKTKCVYPTNYGLNEDLMLWYIGFKNGAVIENLPDVLLNFRMSEAMFKQRRNGYKLAKDQLMVRKIINNGLNFGFMSHIYAYASFFIMIAPTSIRKIAYKYLR